MLFHLTSLFTNGAILELAGEGSHVEMGGASLSITCPDATKFGTAPFEYVIGDEVEVPLIGVPTSCAGIPLDQPCVELSTIAPREPLFQCSASTTAAGVAPVGGKIHATLKEIRTSMGELLEVVPVLKCPSHPEGSYEPLSTVTNMNEWYKDIPRDAGEGDCRWWCEHGSSSGGCVHSEFSSSNNGECKLFKMLGQSDVPDSVFVSVAFGDHMVSPAQRVRASTVPSPSPPPPAPPIANLLENGGFEDGKLAPWTAFNGGGDASIREKNAASWIGDAEGGDYFMHLKGSCGENKGKGIQQEVKNLEEGQPYVLTFWASGYYDDDVKHGNEPAKGNKGEVHIVAGGSVDETLTYKYTTHAWSWGPSALVSDDKSHYCCKKFDSCKCGEEPTPVHEQFQHEFVAPASTITVRMVESMTEVRDCINIDAVRLFRKPYS